MKNFSIRINHLPRQQGCPHWLMNNDRNFLRELFLKYGYDKSDIINKMMIDEVKEEGELPIGKEYKELFVSKGADGAASHSSRTAAVYVETC